MLTNHEILLLFSGGLDSTTLLYYSLSRRNRVVCLFIDYGQAAVKQEWEASQRIAHLCDVEISRLGVTHSRALDGEIPGRNALLLSCALIHGVPLPGGVALGIHQGTPYPDCSRGFVIAMQRLYDLHYDGRVRILAPYLRAGKKEILKMATDLGVPTAMTFSCEKPVPEPCGACPSCIDRKRFAC